MVIHDLELFGPAIMPHKTNPPLVIDADRMLSSSIAPEDFKSIAGWLTQIIQCAGSIEKQ
jgi:hypothetical protein